MSKINTKNILKKIFKSKLEKKVKKKAVKKKISKSKVKKNNKTVSSPIDSKADNLRISKTNEVKPEIKKVKKQDTEKREKSSIDYCCCLFVNSFC